MTYSVDRIEGDVVVLADDGGQILRFSREQFPPEIREGSCVRFEDGVFAVDEAAGARRRRSLFERMRRLQNRNHKDNREDAQ
ncbi:MAG: DUF3006 domain-containing protein [Clostridia bacterium]|nr:DUF3006 domain-containing protein [Clostridia bacterium]MBR0510527.1 DUF3006 domain-containing protein [Clostridia bacterium]